MIWIQAISVNFFLNFDNNYLIIQTDTNDNKTQVSASLFSCVYRFLFVLFVFFFFFVYGSYISKMVLV